MITPFRLRIVVGLAAVAVLGVVGFLAFRSAGDGTSTGTADVIDPDAWNLPALDGDGRVRLADFEGTPLVVNFFASWCGPCERELPVFADAARRLEGRVAFVAVNSSEVRRQAALEQVERHGLEEAGITLARDVGGATGQLLHDSLGRGMPLTAFYDAGGELLDVARGELEEDELARALERHFGVSS